MQQYAVDSWGKSEGIRLNWAKQHQGTIRAEKYQGLVDAIEAGDEHNVGRRIVVSPANFTTTNSKIACALIAFLVSLITL